MYCIILYRTSNRKIQAISNEGSIYEFPNLDVAVAFTNTYLSDCRGR